MFSSFLKLIIDDLHGRRCQKKILNLLIGNILISGLCIIPTIAMDDPPNDNIATISQMVSTNIKDKKTDKPRAEIRKIIPPNLDNCHFGQKILCYRPVRKDSPMMIVGDEKEGKVIAHNYGHGGSGWTLAPGAAYYVNDLLIKKYSPPKDASITIVGAGVIGLFTAYDLIKKDFRNIRIFADKFDNLTSHKAGGQLAIASMSNSPDVNRLINEIGINTYRFYDNVIRGCSEIKGGVRKLPTYFENREESYLEPYVAAGIMRCAKDVELDFGNGTTRPMVSYDDGIFIDTEQMMKNLTEYLKSCGVPMIQKKIQNFSDIEDKYIVNCSGLGAKELQHDNHMIPVQGHLIMLRNQEPSNLEYMLVSSSICKLTGCGEEFYIFPKHLINGKAEDVGVIGGTFIEGATDETLNEDQFDYIIQNAREFYGLNTNG